MSITIELISRVIFISLFCHGVKLLFEEGMLLYKLWSYFDIRIVKQSLRYALKPVLFCVYCFASFWGGMLYYVCYGLDVYVLFVLTCSVYVNYLLSRIES